MFLAGLMVHIVTGIIIFYLARCVDALYRATERFQKWWPTREAINAKLRENSDMWFSNPITMLIFIVFWPALTPCLLVLLLIFIVYAILIALGILK